MALFEHLAVIPQTAMGSFKTDYSEIKFYLLSLLGTLGTGFALAI